MSEPAQPYRPDLEAHSAGTPLHDQAPVLTDPSLQPTAPLDDEWDDGYEELPQRPRRRLLTPLNLGLLAVLLVAGGFIGGVLVEKGQTSSSSATAGGGLAALARRAGAAGAGTGSAASGTGAASGRAAGGFGAAAGGNTTAGTVSTVSHGAIYVTDSEGNTIKVTEASGGTVSRTAVSSLSNVHPGDTVIVSGPRASDGTITATSIRATAANAAGSALGALFGGGSGAAGAASGGAAGAGSSTSGSGKGGSSGAPSLFGSG